MSKRRANDPQSSVTSEWKRRKFGDDGTEHPADNESSHISLAPRPSPLPPLQANQEYTVGWICALSTEHVAARALLDEEHRCPQYVSVNDKNAYTLGSIGGHNVVIALLPDGEYGTDSAARVASDMLHTFPSIRIGLMVGIGGGVPSKSHDIRLGDVVVGTPSGGHGGVMQYDFGKTMQDQSFRATRFLNQPPTIVRSAVSILRSEYEIAGHHLDESINNAIESNPRLRRKFARPDQSSDRLYIPTAVHPPVSDSCTTVCDDEHILLRPERQEDEDNPAIHYGLIASGNQVMKDAISRDRLAEKDDILCFEMEAAGLMNHFPCLVIRGICDYSDSHKNKEWQGYAAMTAAAYAKDLLRHIAPSVVEAEDRIIDMLSGVQEAVSKLLRTNHTKETQEILDWLTPVNYWPQQTDNIKRWQPGTGQWLLESPKYQEWANTKSETLFCTGIPGAGKTILTSIVVNDLITKYTDHKDVAVAFLYCNFRRQHEQRADDLLSSLLKQLSEAGSALPSAVTALYYTHGKKKTRPLYDEVIKTLALVVSQFRRVFFVVDALDECQATAKLCQELLDLQTKCKVNIFATSRPMLEIKELFKGFPHVEISATDEDVRQYLTGRIDQLQPFVQENLDLQRDITTGIAEAVDGMFLLAQIYLNSLEDKLTAKDIRGALHYFLKQKPGSSEDQKLQVLSQAYELSLERINSQRPGLRELAHKVLYWITCAKRPLTKIELQHALAVEIGASHLDTEAFTQVEKMVSVCAGLVTVDEDSGIIRLVHYTTQEYFDGILSDRFPNAEADIANACISYLSFESFATGICTTDQDLKQRLALYPLYNYAARNWGFHALMAPIENIPLVIDLLQKEGNVLAAAQVMMIGQPYSGATRHNQRKGKQITGPHLATYFGLRDALEKIIENGQPPDEKDSYGQTPLSYASEKGHEAVVELLLETPGVECHQADEDGRSPLSYAAENGHTNVVQLLLRAPSCRINNWDIDGRTPLSYAAAQGHAAIVEKLCDVTSVDADTWHLFGRTPLSFASEGGHERVVEIILTHVNRGSMINDGDADKRTPLSYSAQKGHEGVVKLLLKMDKIDPEIQDRESRSPFSYAAEEGHLGVIDALLATSVVNANSRQRDGRMPLLYAARRGHTAVVNRLLQIYDVEVDPRDREGRTPLSYAAEEGHVDVVRLLLAKDGVDVHSTDRKGGTPLSYAEERRQVVVVGLLSK